ncbi:MAG: 4-hydroxy-tetrahydrodipicolinate synthase [Gemmatimonadetes bacterium]|nr:4-hydroxy-tetrahydrodipicolinate synthase [Gemmatimonadota bacterium]
MTRSLAGCATALVTPFAADGSVDETALAAFVDWQLEEGIDGLVPVGSTGEAATMSLDERLLVARITAERADGRVPVIAGAGGNDTKVAIETSKAMVATGATHLLHVSPAYSKPPQRGILAHFRAIADASTLPIVVYNVPGRTASNIEAETTLALAEHSNIVAVKEASGNLAQISEIIRHAPSGFEVLSGDDGLTLGVIAAGGHGLISVVSNAAPRAMTALCKAAAAGRADEAKALHLKLHALCQAAFCESNPIPIKAAVALLGKIENRLRLPLVTMDSKHYPRLRASLVEAGALTS